MTVATEIKGLLREANSALIGSAGGAIDIRRGVSLYRRAAELGDPAATLRLAVFTAEGTGCKPDWQTALNLLLRAAELGDASAQAQLELVSGSEGDAWASLRQAIDLVALLRAPPLRRLSDRAMVAQAPNFAPPGFGRWLIDRAESRLIPAPVYEWGKSDISLRGNVQSNRTATGAGMGVLDRDFVCAVMQARAESLCGIPVRCHEGPNVLSYEIGQKYGLHYDFIPSEVLEANPAFKRQGQRVVTFVTYLNEDFDGGATRFPRLGVEFRGKPGDAIVFSNVRHDGTPDLDTLHEGAPVQAGRKWVLSQWIRDRPQLMRG